MSRLKLPIIISIVLAAAGAGLFFSGMVGGSDGASQKYVLDEPIGLTPPDGSFVVNLADSDQNALLSINVALELEPMDEEHWAAFTGAGGGGHGGGGEAPGPLMVAKYPKFHDAVLTVASTYPSAELLTEAGKARFKKDLLTRFHHIAERDAADLKGKANGNDPTHVGPPYHVLDVHFTKYAIQTTSY